MDVTFSELKQKDVINLFDGRNLGRVCDISFSFPENRVLGFTVTGSKGFKFTRQEIFLPINTVNKIGADVILVNFGKEEKPDRPPHKIDKCPPPNCCPPPCPPNYPPQNRRSLDEYD